MFRYLLFDLDGTLTDPYEGITNSVAYALGKFGISVDDKRKLIPFIGPPLYESFVNFYGFTAENAEKAVALYREYFSVKGIYENAVCSGIPEVLSAFRSRGKKLIVATSKPEKFALRILKKFGLSRYFDFVAGATMDSSRVSKSDVVAYALEAANVVNRDEAVMIGDREYDIIGAKNNGISSVGVLYGYGTKEELISAGANYIAASPLELLTTIC